MKKKYIILIVELLTGAASLMLASFLFKSLYIENFFYACVASIIISLLSVYLKPILKALMLPINILTLGLISPIVNVIILKLTGLILGSGFVIKGFIIPIIISLFISAVNYILNNIIVDRIKKEGKK